VGGESGIVIINPASGRMQTIYRGIGKDQSLNDNAVYSIFRDKSNNMWVGTYFGGINLWNEDFDKFSVIYPGEGEKNMSGKVVREMQEDSKGNLWLALEDGGLNFLNVSTGKISRYFFGGQNSYKNVHSIIVENNLIWIGSFNHGLECYSVSYQNKEPVLKLISSYIPDIMVFDIDKDSSGNIFAGSVGQVYMLDHKTGIISTLHEDKLNSLIIYTLKAIPGNKLLLGTLRSGLYLFNRENNIATSFSRQNEFSGMQTISYISDRDSLGYLIACSNGLYRFNTKANKLQQIVKNSEPNSEFRSVIPDMVSGFWISTTNGLLYTSPNDTFSKKFNRYDGLPENQFNFNSAFRSSDGKLYFGTYNGLISFYPDQLKKLKVSNPEVSFTGYTVTGNDRRNLKSYFLDNTDKVLRLKPFQTFLSIEFSTLGYSRTKDVDYQIRMKGKNINWDKIGKSRSLTITRLSKGWHHLEVRAVVDGRISPSVSSLEIFREPALWETIYAYILYCIIFITVFILFRNDYIKRQKEKNTLEMERFEKEHQQKLNAQKMRFFLNISHEFRTPLTIIGGTITNIIQKFEVNDELKKKLFTIQNTSNDLNKLVDDFLEYGKLDDGLKPIEMKKGPLILFIRKACDMFDNWAEINRIDFVKKIEDHKEMVYFDPFKLERVLYNLLSNAFKFTSGNGEVRIEANILKNPGSKLIMIVSDNGPGISKEKLSKIRKKFIFTEESYTDKQGIGLSYTAGLIHQMKGIITVKSEEGKGSTFRVELPVVISDSDYNYELPLEPTQYTGNSDDNITAITSLKDINKPHILIIDDNSDLLEMLRDSMGNEYHVSTSVSALKALSLVRDYNFEIIICDIMMPDMNGLEVIEKIHSDILTSHIPILILTAAADKEIELKGYKKGAVSYLAKPFDLEELKIKLESILKFRKELIRRYSSTDEIPVEEITYSDRDEQFIRQASEVVNANIQNIGFNVDNFCSAMNVSRTLLHTKLKNLTGLSTTEFIRNVRLKQAYVYLKKGDFSVSEVAFKCGFNDPNYFSRCFKKKYQFFPSSLKK